MWVTALLEGWVVLGTSLNGVTYSLEFLHWVGTRWAGRFEIMSYIVE